MDKDYIKIGELLGKYGKDINEFMELVKDGKLAVYKQIRPYEHIKIDNFDNYVGNYVIKQIEIAGQWRIIQFPRERFIPDGVIDASNRNRIMIENMLENKRNSRAKFLGDKANAEKEAIKKLYVKFNDYENMANSGKSPRKKREAPEIRIKETLEACQFIEKKYGHSLPNKSKDDVFLLVKMEMNYKEPHKETFNDWYTACPFTRRAGNPNLGKKSA